jgi:hypothetical protein
VRGPRCGAVQEESEVVDNGAPGSEREGKRRAKVTEVTWEQSATAAGSEEQRNSWPSNVGRVEEGEKKGRGGRWSQKCCQRSRKLPSGNVSVEPGGARD